MRMPIRSFSLVRVLVALMSLLLIAGCAKTGTSTNVPASPPIVLGVPPVLPHVEEGIFIKGLPNGVPLPVPQGQLGLAVHVVMPSWEGKPKDFGAVEASYGVPLLEHIQVRTSAGKQLTFGRSEYLKWGLTVVPQGNYPDTPFYRVAIYNWAFYIPQKKLPRGWKTITLIGTLRTKWNLFPNEPWRIPPPLPSYVAAGHPWTIEQSAPWSVTWTAPTPAQR